MISGKCSRKTITRRDFLKKTGQAAALAGVGALGLESILAGCATITFKEQAPVVYPPLRGHKVQPPENGCYIGFHGLSTDYYESKLGKRHKIFSPCFMQTSPDFVEEYVESETAEAIPFVWRDITYDCDLYGFKNLVGNKWFKESLEEYAKAIFKYGKPILVSTMYEMNSTCIELRPWKGRWPGDVKKLWRYMWQIFEDNGANEYATWVWTINPKENFPSATLDPELFYPGDQYVDWIGMFVTNPESSNYTYNKSFHELSHYTYKRMRKKHPDKPMQITEISKAHGNSQDEYLLDAYNTIKSWPGIKAVIYWNIVNMKTGDNNTLTKESEEILKQIFKDPYFIGAY
ncbi:MAG: hypothetical protein DRG87_09825 [Deltaproteobacteria bacterium]|nr:MAG: hypothetical protein DRG87_09825 [Deltaproteobacteria bacterium]